MIRYQRMRRHQCKHLIIIMNELEYDTINTLKVCKELLDKTFNQLYLTEQDASDLHMAMATLELIIKRKTQHNNKLNNDAGD